MDYNSKALWNTVDYTPKLSISMFSPPTALILGAAKVVLHTQLHSLEEAFPRVQIWWVCRKEEAKPAFKLWW